MLDFKLAEDLINLALKEVDDAEIYLEDSNSSEISIHQGKVENFTFHQDKGIGIRIFKDGRMGFASSNDFNLNSLKNLIKSLVKNTKLHTFDEFNGLPEDKIKTWDASLYLYDEKIKQENLNAKIKRALEIESLALNYNSRIKGIMKLCYIDNAKEYILINSKGLKFKAKETRIMSYIWVIAEEKKDVQSGRFMEQIAKIKDFNPQKIASTACKHALESLGAKPIKSCKTALVFPPFSASAILSYLGRMLSADEVQKGKSLFKDKLGEKVASSLITLIDDGKLKGGLGSSFIDGEGSPASTTIILKEGMLQNFLYDTYTAKKSAGKSTGNALRSSYHSLPHIGTTNFYLKKTNLSLEKLLKEINQGIYITDILGLHAAINPANGDYSIPCSGLKIHKGELAYPINNFIISGNLFDFLKNIDALADDFIWTYENGIIGTPTFRVSESKVGGA